MKLMSGIRVLDMTNVLAGPFATMHLALLGAEVIKIENPAGGDLARKLGCLPELNKRLMGTSFLAQNANKKSLTLNLKDEKAREIFRKLVPTADVLVENFRPGVMERLGLLLREAARVESEADLLCYLRLRPDRTRCHQAGLRSDHPGPERSHGHQRRRTAESAALRFSGVRHGGRPERRLRHHGRPLLPRTDRRRPVHRRGPAGLDHAPHGLGGGQPPDRPAAAPIAGQRQLHRGPVRDFRHPGRVHQHRRQPAGPVGGGLRAPRSARTEEPTPASRNATRARRTARR